MSKFRNIINGWSNYVQGEDGQAEQRAKECSRCSFAVHGTYEKLMPDWTLKEVQGMKCSKCGCPLSTKLRAKNEKCPIGKW